jgi:hypothetical protein
MANFGVIIRDLAGARTTKGSVAERLTHWARADLRHRGIRVKVVPGVTLTSNGADCVIHHFCRLFDGLLDGGQNDDMLIWMGCRLHDIRNNGVAIQLDGISDRHGEPLTSKCIG